MIAEELKQLKAGRQKLRRFGLLVGAVFTVLGSLSWARDKPHFLWLLASGVALVVLGLVLPKALKQVYIVWMALALLLGLVISKVILTLLFVLVITPVGLAARCLGKDFLRLRLDRQATTYWLPRESGPQKPPEDYERQF